MYLYNIRPIRERLLQGYHYVHETALLCSGTDPEAVQKQTFEETC